MKRLHIHLAVENLEQSIHFYNTLFSCSPIIQHEDYAKWMLDDPRVNFAISNRSSKIGLDHLGIQAENNEELQDIKQCLDTPHSPIKTQEKTACCYSRSDKYWVTDPQGIPWESFRTLNEIPTFNDKKEEDENPSTCCSKPVNTSSSSCCN